MQPFDLLGPLPDPGATTVLEASAGTGKTFALAGLATRYLAEGVATLDQMLLITFSRAATRELRERVREQIAETVAALDGSPATEPNDLLTYLLDGTEAQRRQRRRLLHNALARFDAATIATTHQFCQLVLKSLGVAGDTAAGVRLVESLDELVVEIVDDLYLARFGNQPDDPLLSHPDAVELARQVVNDPYAQLRPAHPQPDTAAQARLEFAEAVRAELELRKHQRSVLGYDDLLSRLATALERDDADARDRLRRRWPIVMVDEFQDTDLVQWQVISRAFSGVCTLILIGDPKQAIYGFRGGDIYTYLRAVGTADAQRTLPVNWRSDQALVDRVQTVLRGAALGHPDIVVRDITARRTDRRLVGAPNDAPFRLRVVSRNPFGVADTKTIPIGRLREHIPADLAADIATLLASPATFDGKPLGPGQVAVIVENNRDARSCQDALINAGVAAVYTGDSDVVNSPAGDAWLCLLEAFDQTHRSGLVRAAAATPFFGKTAAELAAGGDRLTDQVAATLRDWADHARNYGPAAVFEAANLSGMARRVLGRLDGERMMTDLAHISQLLHEVAHRERLTLPALRAWLRQQRAERAGAPERNRRLDSDAEAVQVLTVWGAKGLQFPVVYLPFAFNRHVRIDDVPLFHDDGVRCRYVGGPDMPDRDHFRQLSKEEAARNDIRLTYVALTRAQSQVVAWWAPSFDEPDGGLSRLLRGRGIGEAEVPERCQPKSICDEEALELFGRWEAAGGPVVEQSVIAPPVVLPRTEAPDGLAVRHFHRAIDTTWRRTSYSALIRGAESIGVGSEPDLGLRDDEGAAETPVPSPPSPGGTAVPSPMAGLPAGAAFGSLVHKVLETADPTAPDLAAELTEQVRAHTGWWAVDADPSALADALVPMHDSPLGPLAAGLTLRQLGLPDRLRELDFEIPLAGGDRADTVVPEVSLFDVGELLRTHLPSDDPLASYADRLTAAGLSDQRLRGYLSGSIDVVLRLPEQRYLIVDYKTNRLGDTAADYGPAQLTAAMLRHDYPLQALLYTVVLHRFLRWRQPRYQPEEQLAGVLYLFVRGMCGPDTPVIDGHPGGVFSWRPPAELVVALSDLLDAGRAAA